MRLDADVRRCVMFIGHASDGNADTFKAIGTGFFIIHDRSRYLVTAQHIAAQLDDAPFHVRLNLTDGGSKTFQVDLFDRPDLKWIAHTDANVDLAVAPFNIDQETTGLDLLGFGSDMLLTPEAIVAREINVGDRCYAVGLFRLLQGSKRNVPVVHSGSIALMAGEEPIPVRDWLAPHSGKSRYVDSYLVEMSNLRGLSGAPVFVSPTLWAHAPTAGYGENGLPRVGKPTLVAGYDPSIKLLGVWSGSWEADPSAVSAMDHGNGRIPLGMGSVVPAARLLELLNDPRVAERRLQLR